MTLVSAIVPTFHRPESCARAVRSVLAQRLTPGVEIEAVVVLDGPQSETREALLALGDPRVRLVESSTNRGHAAARTEGVRHARGAWCAFLDDDDEWLPAKIAAQLEAVASCDATLPVVGCRLEARLDRGSLVWPEIGPEQGDPIADYLYTRTSLASLKSGRTLMQTSMILAPTELLRRVPFRAGMRRHADPDWLLRVAREPGVRFVFPRSREPLAVWNLHEEARVSGSGDWRYSIAWARRHRGLMSPRSIAGFLSGPAAHRAGQLTRGTGRIRAFAALARHMRELGKPSLLDYASLGLAYADAGRFRPTRKTRG